MRFDCCCDIQMVGSEFGVKNMKAWIHPCLNSSGWWWWCNGVGDIFTLCTNWASFKCHILPEYCCWPCQSLYDYSVPIFWCYFQQDNAPCHKAQIISDWFLEHDNEFNLLKWPTVTKSQSIEHLGMWWNGRFASWMCSRQICSNCVTLLGVHDMSHSIFNAHLVNKAGLVIKP